MKFSFGSFDVSIKVERADRLNPFTMTRRQQRKLASRVDGMAQRMVGTIRSPKIARIKSLRAYAIEQGMTGAGLKMAKDWVEMAFADGGCGPVAI